MGYDLPDNLHNDFSWVATNGGAPSGPGGLIVSGCEFCLISEFAMDCVDHSTTFFARSVHDG